MRKALWLSLLWLPSLAAAQASIGREPPPPVRVMVLENTATVQFDESLANLQERLHITPSQQVEWAGFARSIDAYSRLYFAEKPQSSFPPENTPQQLARMTVRMQQRLAALQAIEAQAQALYATLNTAQKASADQHLMASIPVFGFLPSTH